VSLDLYKAKVTLFDIQTIVAILQGKVITIYFGKIYAIPT
jgi:hypothetical protein